MRFSDFCQYFSANFRHKHCAALHLVWSDLFYKQNIRNIAGANDSGSRTPRAEMLRSVFIAGALPQ